MLRLVVLVNALSLVSATALAQPGGDDVGCDPSDAPHGLSEVVEAAETLEATAVAPAAAHCEGELERLAADPAPARVTAANRLSARLTGNWSAAELELFAKMLSALPQSLVDRMRVDELRRVRKVVVAGQTLPNVAAFTPNSGGVLQVADGAFDRQPERSMVVILHELLHSTQFTSTGRSNPATAEFLTRETGWTPEIVSTGLFSREYRWSHDGRKIYVGPNYGDGLFPPDNGFEEMVAAMVDYVAAPAVLRRDAPRMYDRLRDSVFGGVEFSCRGR